MAGIVDRIPYVGVEEFKGKVVDVVKALIAELLGTMFLVLVRNHVYLTGIHPERIS